MHARCVCERKRFRSSYFFLTKHVHWSRDEARLCILVHVDLRVFVTWQIRKEPTRSETIQIELPPLIMKRSFELERS